MMVYVRPTPGVYVAELSVLEIDRSARDDWVSVSVALLLVVTGSLTAELTVAVLTRSPVLDEATVAVTVQVIEPPAGMVIPESLMSPEPVALKPAVPVVPAAVQVGTPRAAAKVSATVAS